MNLDKVIKVNFVGVAIRFFTSYTILVVIFVVCSCSPDQQNETTRHAMIIDSGLRSVDQFDSVYVSIADTQLQAFVNVSYPLMDHEADMLVMGTGKSTATLASDSLTTLTLGMLGRYTTRIELRSGDTVKITSRKAVINEKEYPYPWYSVLNRSINEDSLNLNYHIYKDVIDPAQYLMMARMNKTKLLPMLDRYYSRTNRRIEELLQEGMIDAGLASREQAKLDVYTLQLCSISGVRFDHADTDFCLRVKERLFREVYPEDAVYVNGVYEYLLAQFGNCIDCTERIESLLNALATGELELEHKLRLAIIYQSLRELYRINPYRLTEVYPTYANLFPESDDRHTHVEQALYRFSQVSKPNNPRIDTLNYAALLNTDDELSNFQRVLSAHGGRMVFINFWASWCNACIRDLPALDRLQNELSDKDIAFLSISMDDEPHTWHFALDKHAAKAVWENYLMINPHLSTFIVDHKVTTIPRYLVLDREHDVFIEQITRVDQSVVAVREVLMAELAKQ